MRYPLLTLLAVYVSGIVAGLVFLTSIAAHRSPIVTLSLAVFLLLLGVAAWLRRAGIAVTALLLVFTAGMAAGAEGGANKEASFNPDAVCSGALWQGEVVAPVARRLGTTDKEEQVQRVIVELHSYRCAGLWAQGVRLRTAVSFVGGDDLRRGDVVWAQLRLEPIATALNPVGFDPQRWAKSRRLDFRAKALAPFVLHRRPWSVWGAIDEHRRVVAAFYRLHLPAELAALAKALGTGDRSDVGAAQRERWADAGTAHLLAISGLHVATVAVLLFFGLRSLIALWPGAVERVNAQRLAALLCLPVLLLFLFWVGAPVSAVRATFMAGVLLAGVALGRPNSALNALALAGIALAVQSADVIFDISFLLSFVAVLGLLLWQPAPARQRSHRFGVLVGRAWHWLEVSLVASAVATAATAPITAYAFGRFAWFSPVANLLAVPVATFVALPATILAAVGGGGVLSAAVMPLLRLSLAVLEGIASACSPWAAWDVPQPHWYEIVLFYSLLLLLLCCAQTGRGRWLAALCLTGLVCCTAVRIHQRVVGSGTLVIEHPYVGQGDAAIIQFPAGTVMLFDAGGAIMEGAPDPGRQVVAPLLRRHGIHHIDIAVISHPHPDHLGGFPYIAERFSIGEVWWSGEGADHPVVQTLRARMRAAGVPVRTVRQLPRSLSIDGVTVRPLSPRPPDTEPLAYFPELNSNNNSVVLHLQWGARTFFLGGDIEAEAEGMLAQTEDFAAEVSKSPHHGSSTSSTTAWLDGLQARAMVISCGVDNVFGFPRADVTQRYAAYGLQVFRTDVDGLVRVTSDGQRTRLVGFASGREFVVPGDGPSVGRD